MPGGSKTAIERTTDTAKEIGAFAIDTVGGGAIEHSVERAVLSTAGSSASKAVPILGTVMSIFGSDTLGDRDALTEVDRLPKPPIAPVEPRRDFSTKPTDNRPTISTKPTDSRLTMSAVFSPSYNEIPPTRRDRQASKSETCVIS